MIADKTALLLDRALGVVETARTTRAVLEAAASEFDAAAALIGPEVRETATRGRSFWKGTVELSSLTLHQPVEYAARVQNGVDLLEAARPGYDLLRDSADQLGPKGAVGINQAIAGLGELRALVTKGALSKDSPMPPNPRYASPSYTVAETPAELAAAARVYASAGQDVQMYGTGVHVVRREYRHGLSWDTHLSSEKSELPVYRSDGQRVGGSAPFSVYPDNHSGHTTTTHWMGDPGVEIRWASRFRPAEQLAAAQPKVALWASRLRQHGEKLEVAAQRAYESLEARTRAQAAIERPALPPNLSQHRVRELVEGSRTRIPEDLTRVIDDAFAAHRRYDHATVLPS